MVVELVLVWMHKKFAFGLHAAYKLGPCTQESLYNWRHEVPYNLHILDFFFLYLDSFCVNELHHTQHISDFSCSFVPCARNLGTCNIVGSRVLS